MEHIVVGIDGSQPAAAALRWAIDQAKLRGAELTVVHAYQPPRQSERESAAIPYLSGQMVNNLVQERERRRTEQFDRARLGAENLIWRQLRDALDDTTGPASIKRVAIVSDHPGRTLVAQARNADLLVVGARRGRQRFLGSVSRWCVDHATCPVTVIGRRANIPVRDLELTRIA